MVQATRLVLVWEQADLSVALGWPTPLPSGLVIVDASRDSEHESRWHPMGIVKTGATPDGPLTAVPAWGRGSGFRTVGCPSRSAISSRCGRSNTRGLTRVSWPISTWRLWRTATSPGWLSRPEPDHELPLWRRVVAELPGNKIQEST